MFDNKKARKSVTTESTVIAAGMIVGREQLSGDGDISIEGQVKCPVNLKGVVTVREDGSIDGDVAAQCVTVYGVVNGNIIAQRDVVVYGAVNGIIRASGQVHIKSTGRVVGNVLSGSFSIEAGAVFRGTCDTIETLQSSRTGSREETVVRSSQNPIICAWEHANMVETSDSDAMPAGFAKDVRQTLNTRDDESGRVATQIEQPIVISPDDGDSGLSKQIPRYEEVGGVFSKIPPTGNSGDYHGMTYSSNSPSTVDAVEWGVGGEM